MKKNPSIREMGRLLKEEKIAFFENFAFFISKAELPQSLVKNYFIYIYSSSMTLFNIIFPSLFKV